jgi:hypothetical protein
MPITRFKTNNIKKEFNEINQNIWVKKLYIYQTEYFSMFWVIYEVIGGIIYVVILVELKIRYIKLFIHVRYA